MNSLTYDHTVCASCRGGNNYIEKGRCDDVGVGMRMSLPSMLNIIDL